MKARAARWWDLRRPREARSRLVESRRLSRLESTDWGTAVSGEELGLSRLRNSQEG